MKNSIEKLVIIGSGPAGLTAAIYGARSCLDPLVIEGNEPGGQLMGTTYVENWPGETSILGPELMKKMRDHALHFKTRFLSEEVASVDLSIRPFVLTSTKKTIIKTHALIIATGATAKKLGCKGEAEYWSKGVSTCTVCDGAFYEGKEVVIVGGGDTAMESASFMTNFTDKITIVHVLPQLTACPSMQERVIHNPKIKIIYTSTVTEIRGDQGRVSSVLITNQQTKEQTELPTQAVFLAIGLKPNTDIFKNQLEMNNYGHIALKGHTQTSVAGVFAAGDVADNKYRQAITSAGTGCAATLDAERYLKENNL